MDSMMRGDAVARATYLQKRFQTSSITPDGIMIYENENPSGTEAGKALYIMSNMIRLQDAAKQFEKMNAPVAPIEQKVKEVTV